MDAQRNAQIMQQRDTEKQTESETETETERKTHKDIHKANLVCVLRVCLIKTQTATHRGGGYTEKHTQTDKHRDRQKMTQSKYDTQRGFF